MNKTTKLRKHFNYRRDFKLLQQKLNILHKLERLIKFLLYLAVLHRRTSIIIEKLGKTGKQRHNTKYISIKEQSDGILPKPK